jgi:uncharacterized protein YjbI with pentapeptide repeats
MTAAAISDVLEWIARGKPISSLQYALHNGRVDLRCTDLSALRGTRRFGGPLPLGDQGPSGGFAGLVEPCDVPLSLRGISLCDLDFSGSRLDEIRFVDCTIRNCVFDNASCSGWRMWSTSVYDSSFSSANLRRASLGGVLNGKTNRFENVCFGRADMRGTIHGSAPFIGCAFDGARLTKVDFQGSRFARCTFRGEVREVLFYNHAFKGESFPQNTMEDVDFGSASLRHVEFRKLNLDHVKFPVDSEHLVLPNYPASLDYALTQLCEDDIPSRMMRAYLENCRKWIGPRQKVGLFNRLDFLELFGEEGSARMERLLLTTT